jgi:hypothetical protein
VIVYIGVNVGAMGVLTLASILGLVISKRLGLRAKLIAAGDTNPLRAHGGPVNEGQTVRLGEVGQLLATVALSTLVIEAGLAVLLYPSLLAAASTRDGTVGGAVLRGDVVHEHRLHPERGRHRPVRAGLLLPHGPDGGVFLGSIGFPVIFALWRHHFHVRRWSLHAKLTLITTVILFFVGAAVFLLLEYDNPKTFGGMDAWDTTFQAFFLSAMTRSGGFSIVDIGQLNGSSLVVGSMLMFVGGGSASTAGGIKVTTLAVLALAVWSEAKGRPRAGVRPPHPSDVQRVALSVVAWGATIVAVSTITIARSRNPVEYVLFDVVSGFATVGLSTGSPDLPTRRLRPRGDDVHGARWYSDTRRGRRRDSPIAALLAARGKADRWLSSCARRSRPRDRPRPLRRRVRRRARPPRPRGARDRRQPRARAEVVGARHPHGAGRRRTSTRSSRSARRTSRWPSSRSAPRSRHPCSSPRTWST